MPTENVTLIFAVLFGLLGGFLGLAIYAFTRITPSYPPVPVHDKICSLERLREIVAGLRRRKRRIVWTNGCFDLLHAGHVLYLEQARRLGDVLIVGLNSDASARALKGPERPLVPQEQRAMVLAGLSAVDYLVIFEEPTPLAIIDDLRPDVYAKGGDYDLSTMQQDERRLVEGYGGRIVFVPKVEDLSTTGLKHRIQNKARENQSSANK
jgi:D-beta-D-heptose 7-phosphate kinase/D-beta-D-heptose 1-phosphate adenosyltransferase